MEQQPISYSEGSAVQLAQPLGKTEQEIPIDAAKRFEIARITDKLERGTQIIKSGHQLRADYPESGEREIPLTEEQIRRLELRQLELISETENINLGYLLRRERPDLPKKAPEWMWNQLGQTQSSHWKGSIWYRNVGWQEET